MAKYQPEKQYTNHALMDEIVYNTEVILQDLVVKNQALADLYETQEIVNEAEIYALCVNDTIYFGIFPFTEEILRAYGITDPITIREYLDDNNHIPESIRDDLMAFAVPYFIDHYEEKNIYYRALAGKPPIDLLPDEYILAKKSMFDEEYFSKLTIKRGIEYVQAIENGQMLLCDLHPYDIAVLYSNGTIADIKEEYKNRGLRYDYLNHLGNKSIDVIKSRKADRWDILYITENVEKLVIDRFVDLYMDNREIFLRRFYQESFMFDSDYYDEICILMILATTFNDMVVDIPDWYIRRDIFDIRSVQYFLEAYGVKYYKRIPLRYQIRIVKNLNKLIKYKSSDYNFRDILDLFEIPETKIYKYFLYKDYSNPREPDLLFIQTEMGDAYDDYIKDNNARTQYDEITYADKYWDGEDSHYYIRNQIMNKDFTIERTKYYSIDYEIQHGDYAFQVTYFLNLLFTKGFNKEDIRLVVPNIDPEIKFRLSDIFLLVLCYNISYDDLSTAMIKPPDGPEKEIIEKPDGFYIDYDGGYPAKYEGIREDMLELCYPLFYQIQELELQKQKAHYFVKTRVKYKDGTDYTYTDAAGNEYPLYYNKLENYQSEIDRLNEQIEAIEEEIDNILKYEENVYPESRNLDGSTHIMKATDNYFKTTLEPVEGEEGKYYATVGLYKTKIIIWDGCYIEKKVDDIYVSYNVYDSYEDYTEKTGKSPKEGALVRLIQEGEDIVAYLEGSKFYQLNKINLQEIQYTKNVEWNEKFLAADGGDPTTYNNVNEEDFYHWMKKYYSDLYEYLYFDDKKVTRVIGFNMNADLDRLQEMLNALHSRFYYTRGWTLEEIFTDENETDPIERYKDFWNNSNENVIPKEGEEFPDNFKRLFAVYHHNRKCYENIQYKLVNDVNNMDDYRIYKFIFEYLFTIPKYHIEGNVDLVSNPDSVYDYFDYNDILDLLKDRDYILYNYFMKTHKLENMEARRDAIQLVLDQIVDTLEYYIKNNDLDYLLNVASITSFFNMVTYLKFMLDFFKSYKVQFLDPYNTYIIDNRYSLDGSGDGQYHRPKDVITELEVEDNYQDKHFIKDVPPYTEIELDLQEIPPYHDLIKEKMDVIAHYEPDPLDDYDYNGMTPNDGKDNDGKYKVADGGNTEDNSTPNPYFMLNAGRPQLLMRNFWDMNGGTPVEMIDYIDLNGGRSLHPEDVPKKENHYFIPTDVSGEAKDYDLTPYNFNPKSVQFNYIVDAGSPGHNIFVTKTFITRVIDRQITQDLRLSTKSFTEILGKTTEAQGYDSSNHLHHDTDTIVPFNVGTSKLLEVESNNQIKVDENGALYIKQIWTPWSDYYEWKDIVDEIFENSEEVLDNYYNLIEFIRDAEGSLDRTIENRVDEILYGLEYVSREMDHNNLENRIKEYTNQRNDEIIETFDGFNPFEWTNY